MPTNSILCFKGYELDKLIFIKNAHAEHDKEFELVPKLGKETKEVGKNNYDVTLTFSLEPVDNSERPFTIDVSLTGHFKIEDVKEISEVAKNELINKNAVAILFPFLRSTVASLTICANIPPLVLPIVNLSEDLK